MPHIDLRSDLFGVTSLLDYRRDTAEPICALTHLLLRGDSTLSEMERELIATYVSVRNECTFCGSAHAAATCHLSGGDQSVVDAVVRDLATAPISDKLRALLAIAGAVQISGRAVTTEQVQAARDAGATDREVHDTVLIAALFSLYNRYVDGLASVTPTDPAFYDALGARITGRGYVLPPHRYEPLRVSTG
jgi:uncharacterized peroxidase-related enzyme